MPKPEAGIDGVSWQHDRPPSPDQLALAAEVFAQLADPTRLHILWMLTYDSADVTTLAEQVTTSRTSVSQHLAKLRHSGLIEANRQGRRMIYSLRGGHLTRLVREAINHADHEVSGEPHHR
ncbi:metalloregulator ArsR/SmtB family transcription factor [Nocardioidaceae bacterium SCSIO 66511]|nr:metalloregulator ArsR/SmtB family transcription factor [Nocardioidaceae bacterium SCSIO 66511]